MTPDLEQSMLDALHFVVVGAGIAGLTASYLLKQAGHDVTVLEKHPRNVQKDGGLRIPPNMTRLLLDLPRAKALLETEASKCAGLYFRQGDQLNLVGKIDFIKELVKDLGCDFHLISHAHLHNYLYNLCCTAGVQIRHGFEAEKVRTTPCSQASVVSRTGDCVDGNIVIGADGRNSVARQVILDQALSEDEDVDPGTSTFPPLKEVATASIPIPVSLIKDDPELSLLTEDAHWTLFMGDERLIGGGMYGPDLYVLGLVLFRLPSDNVDTDWLNGKSTPTSAVLEHSGEYDRKIKKLIQLVPTCHWTSQTTFELSQYSCKQDQVVLIGDAAHSVPINTTSNVAAAFEDAFTLGRLFSRKTSRSRPTHALLLSGYNQIRHKRTRTLEVNGMDAAQLMGMAPGPGREGRDKGMSLTLDMNGADDETWANVFASYVTQFNYDAREAVDEWWMNWGKPACMT